MTLDVVKVAAVVWLMLFSNSGVSMSIFDVGKVCTFSGVSGVLVDGGEPLKNVKVIRETDYQGAREDHVFTDDDGRFSMPPAYERSVTKLLPQEFVVGQALFVEKDGERIKIMAGVKRKPEENVESKGKPFKIRCDLQSERKTFYVDGNLFLTKCEWDVEHDVIDTGF